MANERTALAWVRTALALVAGGVGLVSVVRLVGLSGPGLLIDLVAGAMCLAGGWVAVSAVLGWQRREIALRTGRPLPAPIALPWLAGAIAGGALLLALLVFAQGR